jgi:stage II sporulation protein D
MIMTLLFLLLSSHSLASNEGSVTVHLFEAHRPIRRLEILPPFQIISSAGNKTLSIRTFAIVEKDRVYLLDGRRSDRTTIVSSRSICLQGLNSEPITLANTVSGSKHKYRGRILLCLAADGSLEVDNVVSSRDYIAGVVAAEAPLSAPLEMLKAQAILAQTVLLKNRAAIIGDSTQCQCYLGADLERPMIKTAVAFVKGKILKYKDSPITAYYHSTCAGGTSAGAIYFHLPQGQLPFLSAVACSYCRHSPFWSPTRQSIPHDVFTKVFGNGIPVVVQSDYTKRPLLIKLGNGNLITGYDFWIKLGQSLGWDKAPGTRFAFMEGKNKEIIIESTGAGHGVGLCQWGASSLARNGKNCKEILQYYFPGCEIR